MYWLRRPPYLRWAVAAALILVAAIWDSAGPATVPYPFATATIEPGTAVDGNVEWRAIPAGLLPSWTGPVTGSARVYLAAGDPLLPSLVTAGDPVPSGWWSIPLQLPAPIPPGTPVQVLLNGDVTPISGVVTREAGDYQQDALVAFPDHDAAAVAIAARDDAIVVMVGAGAFAD